MQLYLLTPIIIFAVTKFGLRCVTVLLVMAGCTITYIFIISYINDVNFNEAPDLWERFVVYPTQTRFAQWLIGLFLGYVLLSIRSPNPSNSKFRWTVPERWEPYLWALSLTTIVVVLFLPLPAYMTNSDNVLTFAFYDALHRVAWSGAIGWIIYGCVVGHGGVLNWVLAIPFLQPLSRLSYGVFILHFPIVIITKSLQRVPDYFSEYQAFIFFLGVLGMSFIVAIPWYLCFEEPVINLEKTIKGRRSKNAGPAVA